MPEERGTPGTRPTRAAVGTPSRVELLRATWLTSLLSGLLFALLGAAGCLVVFAQVPARRAFETHLAAAGVPTRRSAWAVALVLAAHLGYVITGLAGLALLHVVRGPEAGLPPPWLEMVGFGSATLGLTLALRPFVFLPFVLADARTAATLGEALPRAGELAVRAGPGFWRFFDGVFVPAFVLAPLLLFVYVPLGALVAGIGWGGGLLIASAHVAARYAALTHGGVTALAEPARRMPRQLRRVGASACVASLLAAVAVAAALASPTPAAPLDDRLERLRRDAATVAVLAEGERLRLPGTTVEVWVDARAIHVEARDGGGAGRVALEPALRSGASSLRSEPVRLTVLSWTSGDVLLAANHPDWESPRGVRVTREGVRTDDGLQPRARRHLSQLGYLALLVLVVAWLVFLLRSQRRLAIARTLHAIADASELGDSPRPLAALDGTLQAPSLVLDGRRARFDQPAHVVRGGLRVRLPSDVPLLGEGELHDGQSVTLVGRFSRLGGRGLREAALPSPDEPALVAGGRDEAVRVLVAAAAHEGTQALTAAFVAAFVVVVRVLFGLA